MKTTNNNQNEFNVDALLNNVFSNVSQPENAAPVHEMLDKYGLNWNVSKTPLLLPNGSETGFFGIVRDDTNKCFTTCKDSYVPFQNSELGEMLIRISEKTGYNLHSGGSFNGGAKVFLQLESPNKIQGIGTNNDQVNGFLTGLNSHDGSTSLKWGETNITVSCQNTFFAAMKQLKQSARHTASIHGRVEEAIRTLQGVINEEKNMFDQFIKLSEVPVTREAIAKIVKNITDVNILEPVKEVSAYSENRTRELLNAINGEMNQKGQTMWGLMSGVTKYTTHVMPTPKRDNARLESIYAGTAYAVNNESLETILEFMN